MAGVIQPGVDVPVTVKTELLPDKPALVMTVFHQHETTRIEVAQPTSDDDAEAGCAVMTAIQGEPGFMAQFIT